MVLTFLAKGRSSFHLISSGVNVSPRFTARRMGRGGPFFGTVPSTHNSSPALRHEGSTACSGKKKSTGSLRTDTTSPVRVFHRVTRSPVGVGARLATRWPFSACKSISFCSLRELNRLLFGGSEIPYTLSAMTPNCALKYLPRIGRSGSYTAVRAQTRGKRARSVVYLPARLASSPHYSCSRMISFRQAR